MQGTLRLRQASCRSLRVAMDVRFEQRQGLLFGYEIFTVMDQLFAELIVLASKNARACSHVRYLGVGERIGEQMRLGRLARP